MTHTNPTNDARRELRRIFDTHLRTPPTHNAWMDLEERFGRPLDHPEVCQADADGNLAASWGGPDLILYDDYVVGHIVTVLRGTSGVELLRDVQPDARIAVYLDLCGARGDRDTQPLVLQCQHHLDALDNMLDLARCIDGA